MPRLLDAARKLLPGGTENRPDAEAWRDFVEQLTFADADSIGAILETVLAEDWIGFPAWARNLAYRLWCLQRPDDAAVLRAAAADLRSFGPDWDDHAAALDTEADRLSGDRDG